jgi:WXG100 family type VII secretion target
MKFETNRFIDGSGNNVPKTKDRVEISSDTLLETASLFSKTRQLNQDQMAELSNSMKKVLSAWPKASDQSFYTNFKTWEEYMQGFLILLDEISKDLTSIAHRYEDVDNQFPKGD